MNTHFKHYRLNYQISAPTIRLLDETGKQIGVIDRQEALKLAQKEEKDLVEITGKANPPVVKLIDFKKFKYLEAKKERESRKNVKHVGIKEIRLSPFMGDHDFKTRVTQGEEFLTEGNQLKIAVPFKGRQLAHKEFGFEIINRAIGILAIGSKVVKPPHFEGKVLVVTLTPAKGVKEHHVQSKNEKNSSQTV